MQDVLFARAQMAVSLAFHIVFAAIGIALPLLMVLAELSTISRTARSAPGLFDLELTTLV